jgi:hypothetical protein
MRLLVETQKMAHHNVSLVQGNVRLAFPGTPKWALILYDS